MTQEHEFSRFSRWHSVQFGGFLPFSPGWRETDAYKTWVVAGRPATAVTASSVRKLHYPTSDSEDVTAYLVAKYRVDPISAYNFAINLDSSGMDDQALFDAVTVFASQYETPDVLEKRETEETEILRDRMSILARKGVTGRNAFRIASSLGFEISADEFDTIASVLSVLPTDFTGQFIQSDLLPDMWNARIEDVIQFASTPEGQEWAVGLVQDFQQQGERSVLSGLMRQRRAATPEAQRISRWQEFTRRFDPDTGRERVEQAEERIARREDIRGTLLEQQALGFADREQVRLRREAEATFREEVGPLRPVSEITAPALERIRTEVSPSAERFFEREIPRLFEAGGFAERRRAFQERRTRFIPEVAGIGAQIGLTTEEEAELEAPVIEREEALATQRALKDPWEEFLRTFDFGEKFAARTTRERGFFSGQFRPRARFLG